jgi:hypothetical protein
MSWAAASHCDSAGVRSRCDYCKTSAMKPIALRNIIITFCDGSGRWGKADSGRGPRTVLVRRRVPQCASHALMASVQRQVNTAKRFQKETLHGETWTTAWQPSHQPLCSGFA